MRWSRRKATASAAVSARLRTAPRHVTFYVGADDPQAVLDRAEQLGGKTIMPVTELPQVTIALFADPEGHVVGLAKGM
jgi:predicted enzyme related to lactoylglutathione lyase